MNILFQVLSSLRHAVSTALYNLDFKATWRMRSFLSVPVKNEKVKFAKFPRELAQLVVRKYKCTVMSQLQAAQFWPDIRDVKEVQPMYMHLFKEISVR